MDYRRLVTIVQSIHSIDPHTKTTPLMVACQVGSLVIVKKLIQFSADPTLLDIEGNSPIMHCLLNKDLCNVKKSEILEFLLPFSNPVLNLPNALGLYPITLCSNNFSLLSLMIKNGALIDKNGNFNNDPLINACSFGHIESLRMLLEKKRLLCLNFSTNINESKHHQQKESGEVNSLNTSTLSQLATKSENLFSYLTICEEIGIENKKIDENCGNIQKEFESKFYYSIENDSSKMIKYFSNLSNSSQYSSQLRWTKIVFR